MPINKAIDLLITSVTMLTGWLSYCFRDVFFFSAQRLFWLVRSTVGGTPVFGRRTDPVLRSACSRRVTTMWVNRSLQVNQLGQLSLSSFRGP